MAPLQELLDLPALSAPTYAGNDPINKVDPDGRMTRNPYAALPTEFSSALRGRKAYDLPRVIAPTLLCDYASIFKTIIKRRVGVTVIDHGCNVPPRYSILTSTVNFNTQLGEHGQTALTAPSDATLKLKVSRPLPGGEAPPNGIKLILNPEHPRTCKAGERYRVKALAIGEGLYLRPDGDVSTWSTSGNTPNYTLWYPCKKAS